jgi:hypothetical protein
LTIVGASISLGITTRARIPDLPPYSSHSSRRRPVRAGRLEELFVAIEQESTPDAPDLKLLRRSAIESEIPTYRAVSTRAVLAVICGLLAGLSFTHPMFYVFAVAAVLLGWSAERAIRRYPDMLTGGRLARTGVALGLVFGLSIFTVTSVQTYLTTRQAGAFAAEYAQMVKTRSLTDLYWIQLNPTARASISPEENLKQMQGQQEAAMADMKYAGLRKLVADLHASDKNTITYSGIESLGKDDLIVVAIARFDVHIAEQPKTGDEAKHDDGHGHDDGHDHKEGDGHDHKEGDGHKHDDGRKQGPVDSHAMAVVKGMVPEGKTAYEWWVDDVVYPYEPKTAALPAAEKPLDDGHGHAH